MKDETKSIRESDQNRVYRYVPVNQFTPLNGTNWFALTKITSGQLDPANPWRFVLQVQSENRGSGTSGAIYPVLIEVCSFNYNIFRIRFCPQPQKKYPDIVFGPVTQDNLNAIRNEEISGGAPSKGVFDFASNKVLFKTKDLTVTLDEGFRLSVQQNNVGIILKDAVDNAGRGLGATFVDVNVGTAIATIKVNNKEKAQVKERFFGQGEVNVNVGGKSGSYVLGKTGLSMTNFNYDQISYVHPELCPNVGGLSPDFPNYFYPMYFSAPWIIATGNQGKSTQYAYGIFLNNPSQTYTNTGDEFFGPNVGAGDKYYLGAQSGELDYFFVGGSSTSKDGVSAVTAGLSYLCSNRSLNWARHAALPPKYIFGYFQGVYGALAVNSGAYPTTYPKISNGIYFEDILNGYNSAQIPLEGFAIDIDVQRTYEVFTVNGRFYYDGKTSNPSIFNWAHSKGLVTQTNITCFVKDTNPDYEVYKSLIAGKLYTNNTRADGGAPFKTDGSGPKDAYCGQLQYGPNEKATAIFPDWGRNGTAKWWGTNYKDLFSLGLDFVWQDMTTPSMDAHVVNNDVTDDGFDLDSIRGANSASPNPQETAYASSFNWRSYHMQAELTDPRFGDSLKKPFAETRNQHAYSLCAATYQEGILPNSQSREKFKRSYIIARGGQIGSQHFGGLWMGDNVTDWKYLKLMIPMIVSMNMSGISVVGADIGGFAQGDSAYDPDQNEGNPASPELLTRWVQAGFLLPWFRNHYDRWISLDPSSSDDPQKWQKKQHGKPYQELYNEAYNKIAVGSKTYRDLMREAIKMRYRWQEVLYTAAYQNVRHGRPIINSMSNWWGDTNIDYEEKPELNTQFLLGPNMEILVAPITVQGETSRRVYFPLDAGWFVFFPDYDDNNVNRYLEGGVSKSVGTDVSSIPILVCKGAILPTRYTIDGGQKPINGYDVTDPLVFDIFSARSLQRSVNSTFVYLDDGGVTTNAEDNGDYNTLTIRGDDLSDTSVTFNLSYESSEGYSWSSAVYLRLRAVGAVSNITVKSQAAQKVNASDKFSFFKQGTITAALYWLDENSGSVWVRVPQPTTKDQTSVTITCSNAVDQSKPI